MQKNRRIFGGIIIILITIILILLYFMKFGKIQNTSTLPTGNIDVFDIDINIDCKCEDKDNCICTDIPKFNETTDNEILGTVFASDENGNYIYQQNLNIFNNSAFEYTNKIAPGVSNTYNFVVHNSSNSNLKYHLEMYENTEYKVNLKYRLRKNNEYVIGDYASWVSASELQTAFSKIQNHSSDSYSLDWKWFDDDENDTIAGKNMTSEYELNVRFYFEETNN